MYSLNLPTDSRMAWLVGILIGLGACAFLYLAARSVAKLVFVSVDPQAQETSDRKHIAVVMGLYAMASSLAVALYENLPQDVVVKVHAKMIGLEARDELPLIGKKTAPLLYAQYLVEGEVVEVRVPEGTRLRRAQVTLYKRMS